MKNIIEIQYTIYDEKSEIKLMIEVAIIFFVEIFLTIMYGTLGI